MELKLPDESVKKVTLPIGLDAPDAAVSVTIVVHLVDWPTTTGLGTHVRLVLVGSLTMVWVTFPSLTFSGRVSPVFLFTKTHLSVVPTLLGEQAGALAGTGEG